VTSLIESTKTLLKLLKLIFPEDNELSPVNIFNELLYKISSIDERSYMMDELRK